MKRDTLKHGPFRDGGSRELARFIMLLFRPIGESGKGTFMAKESRNLPAGGQMEYNVRNGARSMRVEVDPRVSLPACVQREKKNCALIKVPTMDG